LQARLGDPLLTALTIMLAILLFVIAPLQAGGVIAAHYFGLGLPPCAEQIEQVRRVSPSRPPLT
jgi:hypothetical protein